jgi:hypothetical protein
MVFDIHIVESLLGQIWFLPLLIVASFSIYYFEKQHPASSVLPAVLSRHHKGVWIAALALFIIFSAPFWLLGPDAPHGGSDDTTHTLQTYL